MKYHKTEDGEVRPLCRIPRVGWVTKIACCDCGLVHKIVFQVRGQELTFAAWRDARATAAKRRKRR